MLTSKILDLDIENTILDRVDKLHLNRYLSHLEVSLLWCTQTSYDNWLELMLYIIQKLDYLSLSNILYVQNH